MRTEKEMMDLILNVAKTDERIRAVYMNGSRTNSNVPKDIYQDYDIVYVVTETNSFLADSNWISVFGKPIMVQEPDLNDCVWGAQHDFSRCYAWLILLDDGNRIDLTIVIKEEAQKNFNQDKLTMLLLDKDDFLPNISTPSDEDYHIKKPTEPQYQACCNNYFWCLNNVAKGIARDELPYAMDMYNCVVRNDLNDMICWYIGIITDFSVSAGKMNKYFKKYLPTKLYEMYTKTYCDSKYENFWDAIFIACELFSTIATEVANQFDFTYNKQDNENMLMYLNNFKHNSYTTL